MDIQTSDQLWHKVQSLEQQIVPMKEWRGGDAVKTVSVDALGVIEEDLLSVLNQIKILAQKTFGLDEKKFIEASRKFSDVVGCLLTLRGKCKIVDYKILSAPEKVGKFFKEFLGESTYILTKSDPIDVFKVQQDIRVSIRDMLLHQAPFYPKPNRKTKKNVWGVEKNRGPQSYVVKIWIGQKDNQLKVFDAIVSDQGISVASIPGIHESWEDVSKKIREELSIPGVFNNAVLLRQDAEKKMEKFIVNKEPLLGVFEGAWYVKKEENSYFFVKGAHKRPIFITVEGSVFVLGKNPGENIEDVLGETKETCLAQIYKEKREKTLKKLRSKGVQGAYRDGKIYFSGGEKEVDLSREENDFGSVIVYDIDKPNICTLVCVRPGIAVSNELFEIQEDGQISPELDVNALNLGCLKRVFFLKERKIFEKMVKKDSEQSVDIDGLRHCCMASWCEPLRGGYRFVYKKPTRVLLTIIENTINKFFGSLNVNQPMGYAVEVFGSYKKMYYPISFRDNSFLVDAFDRTLSDISIEGISRKIEETWKVVSLAGIYKEISENKKKVREAVQAIENVQIKSKEPLSVEAVETRLSIPSELNILGEHEVWNNFDYIGCTWEYENEFIFSVRQKGKIECSHFFLDIRSRPGKIVMENQGIIREVPCEEFKVVLGTIFSKIAFPEVWDKKYVEIRPFIDAFRAVDKVKMKREAFFKNVRFLGENAEGALYIEVSDIGKVVVYGALGRPPKTINLLSAVQEGKLVVDGAAYNTVEEFLFYFSNKKWVSLSEIEQLVVEKKVVISTYVNKKGINSRRWAYFEREGRRPWEICFVQNFWGFLRSFFVRKHVDDMMNEVVLQLSADGEKKIALDFVLKGGEWWIRADHRDFLFLPELLRAYGLKAEDRYELIV